MSARTIPRIKFDGDDSARLLNCVFAETLQDLLAKYEDGSGAYPAGYLHTSTMQHEGTCYYGQMWSRDCGRGVMELASLGFQAEAMAVCRYFLSHITYGSHWAREIHDIKSGSSELDGNAMVLLALARTWAAGGCDLGVGREFLDALEPVIGWVGAQMDASPHGGLLSSESELSGNPYTPTYVVYPIFANYAMMLALRGLAGMAKACAQEARAGLLCGMADRLREALSRLVSDGARSYAPAGGWVNAIDGRDGRAYDLSDWVGSSWPVWHWTRQLPFILDSDTELDAFGSGFRDVHDTSYADVHKWMCSGEYFRKYGFVSNSGWTGMAGRHDDTMCGYGQGFFTQAALLMDDINTYTKCMEGIARLGYDGNVVDPLSFEMNPWVMHECFNYENYERGLDHTFGAMSQGRREVMDNPGDEGNLVQAAEIIKAVRLVVGARAEGRKLVLQPRLPWMCETLAVEDWPVWGQGISAARVQFTMAHERWRRRCVISYDAPECFESVDVRLGPFPRYLHGTGSRGFEIETCRNGSWVWVRGLKPGKSEYILEL